MMITVKDNNSANFDFPAQNLLYYYDRKLKF